MVLRHTFVKTQGGERVGHHGEELSPRAANAGCSAVGAQGDSGTIAARTGLLGRLLVLAAWFAMREHSALISGRWVSLQLLRFGGCRSGVASSSRMIVSASPRRNTTSRSPSAGRCS